MTTTPIKPVLKMGEPLLFQRSQEVENIKDPQITQIIEEMIHTMKHTNGVGIAAPQIGYPRRIIAFGFDYAPRYPNEKPVPLTVLINPTFQALSDEMQEGWEGCLSIPGLRGFIPRFMHVAYQALDQSGNPMQAKLSGFPARILQHECDHIDGWLFPCRIKNFKKFGFEDTLPEFRNR